VGALRLDGIGRHRPLPEDPAALARASVGEAVRLLAAIHRAERFCDRNIEAAPKSGVVQAALARLRRRYGQER
jgi:hypothetical protein